MNKTMKWIVAILGIGVGGFVLMKLFAQPTTQRPVQYSTGTAAPGNVSSDFLNRLFGNSFTTPDNTGGIISAAGGAASNLLGAFGNLSKQFGWFSPSSSPVTLAQTPAQFTASITPPVSMYDAWTPAPAPATSANPFADTSFQLSY